jgi:hypothetical protein
MDHGVNLQVCCHHHAHRIHQERHVVSEHLQQTAPRRRIVRAHYPYAGLTSITLLHELQQVGNQSRPLPHRMQIDITGSNPLEKNPAEGFRMFQLGWRHPAFFQCLEHIGLQGESMGCADCIHGIY